MMEENKNGHPENCPCPWHKMCGGKGGEMMCGGMCGWCGRKRFMFLRLVLGILILIFVFCAGIKLGEFKASVGSGYMEGYWGTRGCSTMMGPGGYYLR